MEFAQSNADGSRAINGSNNVFHGATLSHSQWAVGRLFDVDKVNTTVTSGRGFFGVTHTYE
jgi:hypothetical protein